MKAALMVLAEKAKQLSKQGLNEANTKSALVMPFLQALGYDVFNPEEVAAEYIADVRRKKEERIDYAILRGGAPVVFIECKQIGAKLDDGKCAQLGRYFDTTISAKIGILTDGVVYKLFTDLDQPNRMDDDPYHTIVLTELSDEDIPHIANISRDKWNIEGAISAAESLKYLGRIKAFIENEIAEPSERFVSLVAQAVHPHRATGKVRQFLTPIIKKGFREYMEQCTLQWMDEAKSKMKGDVESNLPANVPNDGTETTESEYLAFLMVRTLLHEVVDMSRVVMRDVRSYCGVLLDDNNRKPICRFYNFYDEGQTPKGKTYIEIFNTPGGEKFPVDCIEDVCKYNKQLEEAVRSYL